MLERIKNLEPKILSQQDILVDGHPGRFATLETNNGLLMRVKFFFAGTRLYIAQAIVKKGVNWENDFEIPAMAFLDSLRLINTK
jgi:hypothetical protein